MKNVDNLSDLDMEVNARPLTPEDVAAISDFIRRDKLTRARRRSAPKPRVSLLPKRKKVLVEA